MTQSNRERLESFRPRRQSGEIPRDMANEILRIIIEEWDAHYSVNMYCDACVFTMADFAFGRMDSEKQ